MGERLSNADIAAASLLAPMFSPLEHPIGRTFTMPPRLIETASKWQGSAVEEWILELYRDHRRFS